MTQKNILIITQDYPPVIGGIQTYLDKVSQNFQKSGHEVTVICPGKRGEPEEYKGIRVIRIPIHSSWLFLPLIAYLPVFLRDKNYSHILYGQWQNGIPHFLFPFFFNRFHCLCLVHGRELLTSVLGPLAGWLRPKILRKMQGTIFHSAHIEKKLHNMMPSPPPTHVVYPGVDPEEFFPVDYSELKASLGIGNGQVITSLSRWVKRKNLDQVLNAFSDISEEFPDLHLVIAGSGPEKESMLQLKNESPARDRIHFPGRLPDHQMKQFYSMGDVYVLPSVELGNDIEGFGIVFLEAGACERPVIGARSGGIPDAIEEGKSGLIIEPGDTEQLATFMRQVLNNPSKAQEMGKYARDRVVNRLTWKHTADNILKLMTRNA